LTDYLRYEGEKYFGCKILSRYSNIENGIIAQQTLTEPSDFTINHASYYVEILDMIRDEPVPYGHLGRIIITDYFNDAMPLIRYDTGDLGIMESKIYNGVEKLVLSKIEGR